MYTDPFKTLTRVVVIVYLKSTCRHILKVYSKICRNVLIVASKYIYDINFNPIASELIYVCKFIGPN